jgi:glycosyltransferase involved in cell wall biosynthesis
MKSVAILPAYNLEKNIRDVVLQTKEYVDTVIVVSDGSTDRTHLEAMGAGAHVPQPTLSRGKGYAIRKGIEYSKQFQPAFIVLMDADGQHRPEDIPAMLDPLISRTADCAVGSRMKGQIRTSRINKFGNIVLATMSFLITKKWFSDTESGFRSFDAEKLFSLKLESVSYEIETELLFKSLDAGFTILEVPIYVPVAIPGITIIDGIKVGLYKIKLGLQLQLKR